MKKLLNKKGFTLMEMLIVVAIIVILVAVSIPAFSGALDKAKVSADAANFRSAKAAAVLAVSMGDGSASNGMIYDVESGKFVASSADAKEANKGSCSLHTGAWIEFDDTKEGVYVKWVDSTGEVDPCN